MALAAFSSASAAGQKKNLSFMELEFQLVSRDGTALAHFPMAAGRFYDETYETSSSTDANGKLFHAVSKSRESLPLVEPLLAPDQVIRQHRMSIYLPSVSEYGDYQVTFVAPAPKEGPVFENLSDRPRRVPTEITVSESAEWDSPSTFAHGAYYHGYTGRLSTTTILGNGEERLVPVTPRGSRAFLEKITVSARPRLQVSSTATPLEGRRGWRFEVLLVLEPFAGQAEVGRATSDPQPADGDGERVVLKPDEPVRVRGGC